MKVLIRSHRLPSLFSRVNASLCLPSSSAHRVGWGWGGGGAGTKDRSSESSCSSDLLTVSSAAASLLDLSDSTTETHPGDSEVDQYS